MVRLPSAYAKAGANDGAEQDDESDDVMPNTRSGRAARKKESGSTRSSAPKTPGKGRTNPAASGDDSADTEEEVKYPSTPSHPHFSLDDSKRIRANIFTDVMT